MTKSQIKAELRRSACEDADPWAGVSPHAFHATMPYRSGVMDALKIPVLRIFFLLVAEAL